MSNVQVVIPVCVHCTTTDAVRLRRKVLSNGANVFLWYCVRCNKHADSQRPFVSTKQVDAWIREGKLKSVDNIPFAEHRVRDEERDSCVVCGDPNGEYHHWMPKFFADIVGDFEYWPQSPLCRSCHERWHNIVTPYIHGFGRNDLGQDAISIIVRRGNGIMFE